MNVEEAMEKHGFRLSASCSGKAAYTKFLKHKGKRAYISITGPGGEGFPATLEEPVRVAIHDLRSGDEVGTPEDFASVNAFLESLAN
jgi:hypothetical protein